MVHTRSLSPHLRPFGPHTKMKVEYPRAFLYIAGIEGGLLRVAHPKTTFQYECRPRGCSIKAYDFFFLGGEEVIDWPYFSAEFLFC